MSADTPGPWQWFGPFTVVIPHRDGDTFLRANQEDARLIAAAPELLAALKEVAKRLEHGSDIELAQRAIAKAEGTA